MLVLSLEYRSIYRRHVDSVNFFTLTLPIKYKESAPHDRRTLYYLSDYV